jgi:SAM-dependent methyltransferase
MGPGDVAVEDVHSWMAPLLGRRRRVLEVGCGSGDLARLLGADGCEVTALDLELGAPAAAAGVSWVEGDFLGFAADPFEVVLFTRSLHHIHPLERAVDRAVRLLCPGGLLLVDEFDRAAPDSETARWYYEAKELLAAAGVYPDDRIEGGAADDPIERWHAEHEHIPPLHTGAEMIAAISDRFTRLETRRGPYLYRSIATALEVSERGAALARQLYGAENRRLRVASLAAIGLRISARARP